MVAERFPTTIDPLVGVDGSECADDGLAIGEHEAVVGRMVAPVVSIVGEGVDPVFYRDTGIEMLVIELANGG